MLIQIEFRVVNSYIIVFEVTILNGIFSVRGKSRAISRSTWNDKSERLVHISFSTKLLSPEFLLNYHAAFRNIMSQGLHLFFLKATLDVVKYTKFEIKLQFSTHKNSILFIFVPIILCLNQKFEQTSLLPSTIMQYFQIIKALQQQLDLHFNCKNCINFCKLDLISENCSAVEISRNCDQ